MFLKGICFLLGISLAEFSLQLPSTTEWIIILFLTLLTIVLSFFRAFPLIRKLAFFMGGLSWGIFSLHTAFSHLLPRHLEQKPLELIGTVSSVPTENNFHATQFNFSVEQARYKNQRLPWQAEINLNASRDLPIKLNQRWHLIAILKRPHTLANPGTTDREAKALSDHIYAYGRIKRDTRNHLLNQRTNFFSIAHLRAWYSTQIQQELSHYQTASLIRALTVGNTDNITTRQWEVLRNTGTTHLMAISGLHIGLVALLIFGLVVRLVRLKSGFILRMPAAQWAMIAGLIGATAYAVFAGFSIPTRRALIMLFVLSIAKLLRRETPIWHPAGVALLIILFTDPFAPLSSGFWLSFAAVLSMAYVTVGRIYPKMQWQKARVQLAVTLGLIPLSFYFFRQTSLISIVANSFAIAWIGFGVVPFSLLGVLFLPFMPQLAEHLFQWAAWILQICWQLLEILGQDIFQWFHRFRSVTTVIVTTVGILLLLSVRGFPRRYLGILCLLPLLVQADTPPPTIGNWRLTILEVGQGLATVIQTANHVLIYDTGPRFGPGRDAATQVILPYLHEKHIKHIDTLVVSHRDSDHSGGVNSLMKALPIQEIFASYYFRDKKNHPVTRCTQGIAWEWDGIQFEFLHPDEKPLDKTNNNSCVLRITGGGHQVLLAGDIEQPVEERLYQLQKNKLKSDILIAPHHGSLSSSSENFIQAVSPQYVIFSVGYANRFAFPRIETLEKYQKMQAVLLKTSETGTIQFELNAHEPIRFPNTFRDENWKIWY